MAKLPPVQLHTVHAIHAAFEAQREEHDSNGLPMSALGSECDRQLWYSFRWASPVEQAGGQRLRLFETGTIEEERLIADLRRAGFKVLSADPGTGRQWKLYAVGGHLRGKLDGQVHGLPEAPATWHVLECKSHNERSFKDLAKKGLRAAKPANFAQCQIYMHLLGLERCLYLAVNKNNDELWADRVHHDPAFSRQLIARVERVIAANRAPPKIADDPAAWPCLLCRERAVCHDEAFGRRHCRTCLHATPVIAERTDAPWRCERFGQDLTLDAQRAGCPAHLYLPDVVPGEQTDAGDNWVAYRLPDGRPWRDGAVEPEAGG
jgi:hypothetical protein